MNKKLYYTVEKCFDDSDSLNGNKTINVYEIIDNAPKMFCLIDSTIDENSKDAIINYLNDNGFGDDEYDLILL